MATDVSGNLITGQTYTATITVTNQSTVGGVAAAATFNVYVSIFTTSSAGTHYYAGSTASTAALLATASLGAGGSASYPVSFTPVDTTAANGAIGVGILLTDNVTSVASGNLTFTVTPAEVYKASVTIS